MILPAETAPTEKSTQLKTTDSRTSKESRPEIEQVPLRQNANVEGENAQRGSEVELRLPFKFEQPANSPSVSKGLQTAATPRR